MNPVLQTFSDEYRELTLQKECVFRACFSSFELLPASQYSPAAPCAWSLSLPQQN